MNDRARGFTLLEVLVAVAILGLGLTAILSAQAGAFASAAYARHVSVATGLLRCKVSEVEEHLYKEGFQDTDETGSGPCCEGDETPGFTCTWRADRPTFPEAKFGDLNLGGGLNLAGGPSGASGAPGGAGANPLGGAIGMLMGGGAGGPSPLSGAGSITDLAKTFADANTLASTPDPMSTSTAPLSTLSSSSGLAGAATGGAMGPGGGMMGGLASMAMSIVYPSLKLLFEASTRRITAVVTFREGQKERTIEVVEWFAVPQKGLAATDDTGAGGAAASGNASSPSSPNFIGRGAGLPTPGMRQ